MHYLIKNGEIVGKTESPWSWEGWEIAEFEDQEIDDLYWNGQEIRLKPPKPSPWAVWENNEWVVREPVVNTTVNTTPETKTVLNFAGLESAFRNTEIFSKVGMAAAQNTAANFYLTMILHALTSGQTSVAYQGEPSTSLSDLRFGFTHIRPIMASLGLDFSPEQLKFIKNALVENNFDPAEFGLDDEQ